MGIKAHINTAPGVLKLILSCVGKTEPKYVSCAFTGVLKISLKIKGNLKL